jgi:molybdopterin converting factor small subunit
MAVVNVNLYAAFRAHIDGQPSVMVEIDEGETVEQLLTKLGVPVDEARIIFCNNRIVDVHHALAGGESLGVFPAIGGG